MDKLKVNVGNEKGQNLKTISLKEYLNDISKYLSESGYKGKSLFSEKSDKNVIVSA